MKHSPKVHHYEMKAAFEHGRTLQEIGDLYGISRERVRQILTLHFGTSANNGGHKARAKIHAAQALARRNAKYLLKYGHSLDEHLRIRKVYGHKTLSRYLSHKTMAKFRGIGWEFNFAQWMNFWLESGHWNERGVTRGKYVMCRKGDVGPYSRENCYIAPGAFNLRSYQVRKKTGVELTPPQ